mgnify:FL=1
MSDLKNILKDFAGKADIDLIGFGAKDRFGDLAPESNPFTIFPEGNTVILIGERMTRGSLRGIEEGSNFIDYSFYSCRSLDDVFNAQACYDVTCVIEDYGFEAVPVFHNPPESAGMGSAVSPDKPAPNVTPDFKYAAVACGLGEIGLNGEVLTPEYGTRQRFQMIITDAVLESDSILEENICDKCGLCAAICPLNAIDMQNISEISVCGSKMEVASIDMSKCAMCKNGAIPNRLFASAAPDRIAALCNRTCLDHLEKTNRLANKFTNPFRTREPWAKDIYGKSADSE